MRSSCKPDRLLLSLLVATGLVLGAAGARLSAQGTIGTILGVVTDESGSVVPGATVTARNTGTGALQSTASDEQGRYTIPALPVGDYEVRTELQGFQSVVRAGIRLSVGAEVVVDFRLPLARPRLRWSIPPRLPSAP
jgi:hypothetical protein